MRAFVEAVRQREEQIEAAEVGMETGDRST
jgi:hypothetical protein